MKLTSKLLLLFTVTLFSLNVGAYTGEVVAKFKAPGDFPTGITWDGKKLWVADRKNDKLYQINPADGKILNSIESPGYWPMGLAWDGKSLWNADIRGGIAEAENFSGKIYKIDPKSGNILHTLVAPTGDTRGITFDGKYLWCVDNRRNTITQFNTEDGTTIKSFKAPSWECRGITYDGEFLWVSDRMENEIYMVNPENGAVLLITDAPGPYCRDLTYDGEFLWAVDYQQKMIYKMKVRDNEHHITFNERHAKISFVSEVKNYGPGVMTSADLHIALPFTRVSQEVIGDLKYSCNNADVKKEIFTDKWGLKSAHYQVKNLKPGESAEVRIEAEVKTKAVRYFIFPEKVGSLEDIPADLKKMYLVDDEKYQINHPVIQNAVKKVIGDETNPYWMSRKIYKYLIDNMYYEMVGGWNTAPTVLARGNGSCSEYSFVFISMCRSAGLPARYSGAVVARGDQASLDDEHHRWVELYLPNYGWIPVDPSGGDQGSPRGQARAFGQLENKYCITTVGGGGSESMQWNYNFNGWYTSEPKTFITMDHYAAWEPMNEKESKKETLESLRSSGCTPEE